MGYQAERLAWEKGYWQGVLSACDGNISQAAFIADVNRQALYGKLHRLGLMPGRKGWGNADWKKLEK